jgi:hypothetical protein
MIMRVTNNILLMSAVSLIVSSCATIELSTGGEKVRVLAPDEVSSCKKLGQTNTSVTDNIVGVKRPIEALERELAIIARNSADNMGGDTIVPLTVIEGGKQSFVVYKCINPGG